MIIIWLSNTKSVNQGNKTNLFIRFSVYFKISEIKIQGMKFITTYELMTLRLIDWNTQRIKTHNDKSIFNIYALELFASQYVDLLKK